MSSGHGVPKPNTAHHPNRKVHEERFIPSYPGSAIPAGGRKDPQFYQTSGDNAGYPKHWDEGNPYEHGGSQPPLHGDDYSGGVREPRKPLPSSGGIHMAKRVDLYA